ncbi:cell envelope integrity protein TolA [Vibrio sp. S4M6]|uniref:cell envelope integrity protein TolA n=1 Tax=Vibrio sinus TaxID=2946865 RepID=UPI00202A080E|nr:cell envelope integrity protein TolA [Vibrio sinus]MCL9782681.1 cell envelope integrity protein TolA [Vibrio sinus]
MKTTKNNKKDYLKPTIISVALHLLLIAILLWGTDFHMSEPKPTGQMVQAVVIDPALVQKQAQQIKRQRDAAARKEQDRLDKLRRESEQLEKNRKAEEERIRKLKEQQAKAAQAARDAEKQRIAQEKQQAEAAKKAALEKKRLAKLEAERKAQAAAAAKAKQERAAREKAARERAAKAAAEKARQEKIAKEKAAKAAAEKARLEKERQAKLAAEKKAKEAALNDIAAQLKTEAAQSNSARARFVASEVDRYGSIYTNLIESNLYVDDSYKGLVCKVHLKLVPAGTSAFATILDVSGDRTVCGAARRAVAQVGSFPLPNNEPKVVEQLRDITLNVKLQ